MAIGVAGLPALVDLRGTRDAAGRELEATIVARRMRDGAHSPRRRTTRALSLFLLPLVVNVPSWTVKVRPADLPDGGRARILRRVAELTGAPPAGLRARLEAFEGS